MSFTPHAQRRFREAQNDHEAMLAAFQWLQAALKQHAGWRIESDPLGDRHRVKMNRLRREVTGSILEAIEELTNHEGVTDSDR